MEISQAHYIETLLKKYGLQDANPVSTPMDPNIKLDDPEEISEEQRGVERSLTFMPT